jgi:putative ABC transport system permease protein
VKLATWLETLVQDTRLAMRVWRKRPIVALTAIVTIALGAGMNIAVFQVIWTVMLRPLPYADPSRLVQIWLDDGKDERNPPENTLIERWRENSRAFTHIASYRPWRVTVASGGDPEQILCGLVSQEFFATLGTPLLAGRAFTKEEMKAGADNVLLLREGYWRRRFAAHDEILGRDIRVDGMFCRVVGIVPDSFLGTPLVQGARRGADGERATKVEPDGYLPISRARVAGTRFPQRTSFVVARLRSETTIAQAVQELAVTAAPEELRRVWLSPMQAEIGHKLRPALLALISATGCVLLIACANLANLLLAQVVMRRREFAVRAALGAGRGRVVCQLLTEAIVLSLCGGAAAILSAKAIAGVITTLYPEAIPRASEGGSQWMIYGFALGATLASGLVFGALPAWRATRDTKMEALRVANLWMSRGSRRWADGLVAVQVGLTAVVLVAAGLLLKSFLLLRNVDIGIGREHIITASVDLPEARFKTREERARFGAEWLRRLSAIPGVSAAGISNSLPLRYTTLLDLLLHVPGVAEEQMVGARAVGGTYFTAMGMQWADGGPFDENRKDQAVVNEAFVRKHLEGRPAVGVVLPQGEQTLIITGVVKDVRHLGLREAARPELFIPFASWPLNPVDTVVRSVLPPAQVAAALRRELRAIDDQIALGRVMTMKEVVGDELAQPRFQAILLGLFAAVAMVLAVVGTYGVIAYNVRSRVPEFGLRRALGASTLDLVRLVLVDGMKAPLIGLGAGLLIGGFAVGRSLEALLYGITKHDPAVLISTASLLGLTGLLACALPSRLAARVDPALALRDE